MAKLARHVKENRRHWDASADQWVVSGERAWARSEPTWGIWGIPNTELAMLPDSMEGMRAIDLGCGTGYVAAWMHRRGAAVYAIDNSIEQLATARRLADLHGIDDIDWVHGNAEAVDQPDGSFDVAISEYGAAIWCDPRVWLPESHRLLRTGGELVFLGHHPLAMVCTAPAGDETVDRTLHRSYFGLNELDWTDADVDPGGIEFNLPVSAWMRLFWDTGFEIIDYIEVRAPESASVQAFWMDPEWSKEFPSEQVWRLRKR